jgi:hypothetical protein
MKICLTILNPSKEQFQRAVSACVEINRARKKAGLFGRVVVQTFSSVQATVLAISWKMSIFPVFSQRYIDKDESPEVLVGLIEITLGRSLKFQGGWKLARGEAEEIRAKCDPNPTDALLGLFPEAKASNLTFSARIKGPWVEVQKLLDEACRGGSGELPDAPPLLHSSPQINGSAVVRLPGFVPELTFSDDDARVSYLLLRPENEAFESYMDSYGCYRLLRLDGKIVKEIPLLWVYHCACGHVMQFDSADGYFEFEFHKEGPAYGFRHDENGKKRLSVTLSGC